MVGAFGAAIQGPLPRLKWLPGAATRLRVGSNIYRREYSGGEFDDSSYGIYAGPRFISNKCQMKVLFKLTVGPSMGGLTAASTGWA